MTKQHFLFPFYHTVSNHPLPHVDQVYGVRSLARFNRDLDFLTKHFQAVGLDELRAFRNGKIQFIIVPFKRIPFPGDINVLFVKADINIPEPRRDII